MKGNKGGLEGGTGQEWASQERAWTKGGEKPGPRTARQPQSFPVGPGAVPICPQEEQGATWKSGTLDAPPPQLLAQKEPHQVYFPSLVDVSGTPSPQPSPYCLADTGNSIGGFVSYSTTHD